MSVLHVRRVAEKSFPQDDIGWLHIPRSESLSNIINIPLRRTGFQIHRVLDTSLSRQPVLTRGDMTDPEQLCVPLDLREKAEDQMRRAAPPPRWEGWPAAALTHELQVHHAELTAQNEELRLAAVELECEHQLYHTLYEHAPTAYFTLDAHTRILQVNQAGAQLLGFDRGRLLNRRFLQFIGPGERAECSRLLETLLHTCVTATERFSLIHRNDERLQVQMQALTLLGSPQAQPTFLLTLTNLTPLFEAQEALHALNVTLEDRVREGTQHLQVLADQFRH